MLEQVSIHATSIAWNERLLYRSEVHATRSVLGVASAIKNCGFDLPSKKVTVNLE